MVTYCICVIISGGTLKIPAHQRLASRGDSKNGDGKLFGEEAAESLYSKSTCLLRSRVCCFQLGRVHICNKHLLSHDPSSSKVPVLTCSHVKCHREPTHVGDEVTEKFQLAVLLMRQGLTLDWVIENA